MLKMIYGIRLRLKNRFDQISNERLKLNFMQALPFWVASLLTGLLAVFYTKLFAFAETVRTHIVERNHLLFFVITPVCFLVSWLLVKRYANYAKGSGIPQVMAAVELATPKYQHKIKKLLSLRIIAVKIASSICMVFGGGVIGREGPTIQIAGSVFRTINEWLPSWWPRISKRNMIMAGAGAGLAAAFNTPLGGIVFTVEELTKTHISFFKTALLTAVLIAGLTAQSLLGPYLYLGYPDVSNLSKWIFLPVIFVAIISGLAGSIMSKIILGISRWEAAFKNNRRQIIYITVCAILLVILSYFVNQKAFGSGKDIMTQVLFTGEKNLPWYMPMLRVASQVISFTTGAAGGVFAPALSAGCCVGSVMAEWFQLSPTNTNLLVLAGMVGFLTGVTRTPFTSAILVLEMTDRHGVIFHLMLAGMVAGMAALVIDKHSFYDRLKVQYIQEMHQETNAAPVKEQDE